MKKIKVNNLSWGLFMGSQFRKVRAFMSDIGILTHRMWYTLNHGYAPQAKWETDKWFISVFREILPTYKYDNLEGEEEDDECVFIDNDSVSYKQWNDDIDQMIYCLEVMDDNHIDDLSANQATSRKETCKKKFFMLFEKYFDYLWD